MRGTSEGVGLPAGPQMGLLVVFVMPPLLPPVVHVLAGSADTSWLAWGVTQGVNTDAQTY